MITGFVGPRGNGKTLLMVVRLLRRYRNGYKLFTNFGIRVKHEKLDAKRLAAMGTDLRNCAIGVDEIHVLLDSRNSMKERNRILTYFILQTRKRNVVLFYTTQDEGQVDIRLRRNTDYWVYCRRLGKTPYFSYKIYDGLTGDFLGQFILDGRKYYGEYDTEETITDFEGNL